VYAGVEGFRNEFDVARSTLNRPSGPLPIGAGFLGWKLEEAQSPHVALLELALENGVRAIWLSFGEDLGRWIEFVRNHDQTSGKSPKTLIFVQVNSVEDALVAAQTWKVDVLVAQGKCAQPLAPAASLIIICCPRPPPSSQASNRADTVRLPLHPF
jgi:nitronate monooxygenase